MWTAPRMFATFVQIARLHLDITSASSKFAADENACSWESDERICLLFHKAVILEWTLELRSQDLYLLASAQKPSERSWGWGCDTTNCSRLFVSLFIICCIKGHTFNCKKSSSCNYIFCSTKTSQSFPNGSASLLTVFPCESTTSSLGLSSPVW